MWDYGDKDNRSGLFDSPSIDISEAFMFILLAEHIMAYLFNIYRTYEIKHHGYNWKGLEIANCEFRLRGVEVVVDLAIIIVMGMHFITAGKE